MIAATLHGPNYFSPNYDFDTIEVFPSLEEVVQALFERYSSNGRHQCEATYLDGHTESALYPAFGGAYFVCYLLTQEAGSHELTEGMRMEAHTAVHGGWRDYTVALDWAREDEDKLIVTVDRAGI